MIGMLMGTEMIMRAHKSVILPPLSTACSTFGLKRREKTELFVTNDILNASFLQHAAAFVSLNLTV